MPICSRCGRGPVASVELRRTPKNGPVCKDKLPCNARRKMVQSARRYGAPRLVQEHARALAATHHGRWLRVLEAEIERRKG
jgi:hypothetical protein